jgi:hypothetical protein
MPQSAGNFREKRVAPGHNSVTFAHGFHLNMRTLAFKSER